MLIGGYWIPAFAGMTGGGDDERVCSEWAWRNGLRPTFGFPSAFGVWPFCVLESGSQ